MINLLNTAQKAVSNYAISCKSVDFIAQSGNTIYKLTDLDNNSYSLRLHLSKGDALESFWSKPEVIRSEMVWLQSLALETDIMVPAPFKNIHGEFITNVNDINCTLLRWVEGEQKPFIPTVEDAAAIGEMTGKLHRQASNWSIPGLFERPSFDSSRILQSLDKLGERSDAGMLNADDTALLQQAGQQVMAMMNTMERTPSNWGMIHADLIPTNLVFHEQEVRPIDFGACGFGYYLVDLGWTFSYIHPAFREQLLQSYAEYYPLPDNYVELLEGFFIAAQLETMNFWLGLPDWQEWLPDHIGKLAGREVSAYMNGQSFLFSGKPYWE